MRENLIFFFISVLPVTEVVLVAASACSSPSPPELSTRSTWSEAVTLGDPDPGVGSLADPDPGAASLADPDPGVGSRADPDPGVGSRRHVPSDLWPIKAARLGSGNSWPQRPQVRRSPTESASRWGGSGSGAGASNKRSVIY
jgi:hypothetical protein